MSRTVRVCKADLSSSVELEQVHRVFYESHQELILDTVFITLKDTLVQPKVIAVLAVYALVLRFILQEYWLFALSLQFLAFTAFMYWKSHTGWRGLIHTINTQLDFSPKVAGELYGKLENVCIVVKDEANQKVIATASLLAGKDGFQYKSKICPEFLENDGLLKHVGVLPGIRRSGLGKLVVSACLDKAKEIGLKRVFLATSSAQTAALSLYRKLGFKQVVKAKTLSPLEFYEIILVIHLQEKRE
jgi:ribosomal protein S18 acetylase RimI-like enzyme